MKAAFLDRDGTINRDYPDPCWAHIAEPELLPGAAEGLRRLAALGYALIVVTNQYIIGEGVITAAQYERFNARLRALLAAEGVALTDIFCCPHRRGAGCACCKPRDGMIRAACAKYPEIELARSFVAGDSPSDRALAENAGLPFFAVGFDGGRRVESLAGLARLLEAEGKLAP